jgi:PmbA protein
MADDKTAVSFFADVLSEASKVADQAEVYGAFSADIPVRFEANRLKEIQGRSSRVVALRIIKNGRIGLALSAGFADPKAIVKMALETAPFGPEAKFEFPGRLTYPDVPVFDPGVEGVTTESMVEMGQKLIDRVRRDTPELMCEGMVGRSVSEVNILNSRGGKAQYKKSTFSVGVEGTLIRGEDMLFVGDYETSCHPIENTGIVEQRTLWQLEMALERALVQTRTMPVIFTPNAVAGVLLSPLAVGFNGRTVFEGASPLKGKTGEKLLDSKLNLHDDPTVAFLPGSRPCDDEGVPSRRNTLVDHGEIGRFLYDLQTAGLAGVSTTGSASRARGVMPGPGAGCLVFEAGTISFDEMVAGIDEGLVIEQLMGAEQGNVLGGDFSGNVLLGFKVEGGRLVGRAKDVMVSGNVYEALKNVVAMGSESRLVHGTIRTPHIWLQGLSVAAKAQV